MSDYEVLRNVVETKCPSESLDKVNQCIEKIISGKSENEKIRKIKSLICHIEGKLNKANYLMVITIGFALIISVISLVDNFFNGENIVITILSLFLLGITLYVLYESVGEKKSGYKDTFILKALYFKLDELIEESKHTETESASNKKEKTKGKKKKKKSSHRK